MGSELDAIGLWKADLNDPSLVAGEDADALPFEGTAAFSRTELMHRDDTSSSEEITYLDSEGNVLGYANVNDFTQDDDTFTNTSYNDANWNWLGSSYSDPYGSGYNNSQEVTADGDVAIDLDDDDIAEFTIADGTAYRVEKGGHKAGSRPEDPYESEYEFYYDANWNLLGGMDKFDNGATITIYDENWNATTSVDEEAAFANLTLTDVDESAFSSFRLL